VDRAETEETTGVGRMRKKAEERGLDKEEEDYFNTDRSVKFIFLICCLFYFAWPNGLQILHFS
jgi:hypothetical protein